MKKSRLLGAVCAAILFNTPLSAAAEKPAEFPGAAPWVDALLQRLADLEDAVTELQDENGALKAKLACVSDSSDYTNVYFDGCNVHVRNGLDQTDSVNSAGNLIVGYDEARAEGSDKSGSHNLVVGSEHNYNSAGGTVLGFHNTSNGNYANVTGGRENEAIGTSATVSGGKNNIAEVPGGSLAAPTVSGGSKNRASGFSGAAPTVSGGAENEAIGSSSTAPTVSGGFKNLASQGTASVSGGLENRASAGASRYSTPTVSGGTRNEVRDAGGSISGGIDNFVTGSIVELNSTGSICGGSGNSVVSFAGSISGGSGNVVGERAFDGSILGGRSNTVGGRVGSGRGTTVVGGEENEAVNSFSSILGGFQQQTTFPYQTIPPIP